MIDLKEDWLTEGHIDFEYKKYLLLAYLQHVDEEFGAKKLYPKLSELVAHYRHLEVFHQQKEILSQGFPKEISALDLEHLKVQYKKVVEDDAIVRELEEIVNWAVPQIKHKLELGKGLYESVEHKAEVMPVGLLPMNVEEGYLMISDYLKRLVNVYYYHISIFESAMEQYRGIHTKLMAQYEMTLTNTYNHIKYELLREHKELPAPATYAIEFKESYPLAETMLPVAKRILVRYVSR